MQLPAAPILTYALLTLRCSSIKKFDYYFLYYALFVDKSKYVSFIILRCLNS